ncbi:MAG TPA: glycogen synthase [Candidatus Eisenbacteria bacterium]|nr:glycogen synthase [Candidatus Eisenbacteria bacterium]
MRVAHLASEMAPLAKVGGLGDVVGALSAEQVRRGHEVVVVLPAYRSVRIPEGWSREPQEPADVPWGMAAERAHFELARSPEGLEVLLVDHAGERRFFDRDGLYDPPGTGQGWTDNPERFLFFSRAAMIALARLRPLDILHAHDQQAAWAPCFARTHDAHVPAFRRAATVFTIHNLGYQGIVDPWILGLAGFARDVFTPTGPFEFWGRVNFMKVGLAFADMISTVSPRYAEEIQSGDEFGFGLEGVLRRRRADLRGILNGLDERVWDPATDPLLPAHYDRDHLGGKDAVRDALAAACGFPAEPDVPIVGMVSRLVEQKGFDLLEQAADELLRLPARFVVLGAGQPRFVEWLERLSRAHPQRVLFRVGHDERFAHWIEGGADLYLMPSRYEPCGLNQMYSMRYGTVPVVRATGGLADTVEEFDPATGAGTGFRFDDYDAGELLAALRRGLAVRRNTAAWRALQRNGMARDFSWRASADGYDALYAEARARVAGGAPTLESVRAAI